jgi:hypothetical protein
VCSVPNRAKRGTGCIRIAPQAVAELTKNGWWEWNVNVGKRSERSGLGYDGKKRAEHGLLKDMDKRTCRSTLSHNAEGGLEFRVKVAGNLSQMGSSGGEGVQR